MKNNVIINVKPSVIVSRNGVPYVSEELVKKLGYDETEFSRVIIDAVKNCEDRITLTDSQGEIHEFEVVYDKETVKIFELRKIAEAIRDAYRPVWNFHYGLVFLTLDGRVVTCNETLYRHSGFRPENVEGRDVSEAFGMWADKILEAFRNGVTEFDINEDSIGRFRLKIRKLSASGFEIIEVLVRTTEEEVFRNLERLFGSLTYPVVVVESGKVTYLNGSARETFGNVEKLELPKEDTFTMKINTSFGEREFAVMRVPGKEDIYLFFELKEYLEMIKKLQEEVISYREMVENSADVMVIVDGLGRIEFVNSTIESFGYRPDEVVGRNFLEFLPVEHLEEIMIEFARFLRTKEFQRRNVPLYTKDGKIRWVEVMGSTLIGNRVLVVMRDITERLELERKLKEREELYRTLVENSLATIFVVQDDRIVYCNPAFEKFTGYLREEWEKQNAYVCFKKVGLEERAREMARRAMRGEVVRIVSKYATKKGEIRYVEFVLAPIEYKGRTAVLGNAIDITETKESEKRARKLGSLMIIATEVNRLISRHGLKPDSLDGIRRNIEELGVKVLLSVTIAGKKITSFSDRIDLEGAEKLAKDCTELGSIVQKNVWTAIPIDAEGKIYGCILLHGTIDDKTLGMLRVLSRDIGLAARNAEIEEMRKLALQIILDNLDHFDTLADKLRNPLAAIKGFIEVREHFDNETLIQKISEHAERMQRILDELRLQEFNTYKIMKMLERS